MEPIELIYPEEGEGERLDQFVVRMAGELTRSAVQRLIEEGAITVNDATVKASLKLKGGERINVIIPSPLPAVAQAEEIPLDILYEDSDLVVVNKPAGMVVHPGAGNTSGTLVNALLGHCTDLSGIGGELRPGIVHRIDKDTSGIVVVAKNDRAHLSLASQFKEHTIKRVYTALVFGSPRTDKGKIEVAIGRHPTDRKKMSGTAKHAKRAVTHWQVVGRYAGVTLMSMRLETGRTHQIRVHLSEAGHPLVGDQVYGGSNRVSQLKDPVLIQMIRELGRQALHARVLGFMHPDSGKYVEFTTEPPADLARLIDYLEEKGRGE